jgi:protein TonB
MAAPAFIETRPTPAASPAETVSQARFDADYLKNPAPPYPPLSRRMGEEGKVVLRVLVNAQGTADSVEIRTSSGSERLDSSAQKAVRNWKFIPAKRGDIAVQSWVQVPIIFKLEQ